MKTNRQRLEILADRLFNAYYCNQIIIDSECVDNEDVLLVTSTLTLLKERYSVNFKTSRYALVKIRDCSDDVKLVNSTLQELVDCDYSVVPREISYTVTYLLNQLDIKFNVTRLDDVVYEIRLEDDNNE